MGLERGFNEGSIIPDENCGGIRTVASATYIRESVGSHSPHIAEHANVAR